MSPQRMLGLAVLLGLLGTGAGLNICYDEYGCYNTAPPYGGTENNPFAVTPYPYTVHYFIMTRRNMDPEEFYNSKKKLFNPSCFDANQKTYVIIHGLYHSAQEPWVTKMCQTILEAEPANCIMMDWSSCSWDLYMRQTQNVRILGANLAGMIGSLQETFGYNAEWITLVGVNVGAHIAGHAGRRVGNLGRIDALDPTGQGFQGDDRLHLNKKDAKFVLVINTDLKPISEFGFGFIEPTGHVHMYPNGGKDMPECPEITSLDEALCIFLPTLGPMSCPDEYPTAEQCAEIIGDKTFTLKDIKAKDYYYFCSHYQAVSYYMDSMENPEKYLGRPCDSVYGCMAGETRPCPSEGCRQMGFYAVPRASDEPQLFYVDVSAPPLAY